MVEKGGTDLHVTTNSPPLIRIDGLLVPLNQPTLSAVDTKKLAYSVLTDAQKHRFEEHLELDISFGVKGLARFRANVFRQQGRLCLVFRHVVDSVPTMNELALPVRQLEELAALQRGLVLVTGQTGCGKSTTLASMVEFIRLRLSTC